MIVGGVGRSSAALAAVFGYELTTNQCDALERYATLLIDEAGPAGGIGPAEADRIFDRHIGDALAFLLGLPEGVPSSLIDVGSGAGLPGVPLAIALPDTHIVLLDRSGRRTALLRRFVRVLRLDNVSIVEGDVSGITDAHDVVTFRASLPVLAASRTVMRLAYPTSGVGLFGLSRLPTAPVLPEPPQGLGYEPIGGDLGVLDSPFWLLRMRRIVPN